jgi:hypothetical protein
MLSGLLVPSTGPWVAGGRRSRSLCVLKVGGYMERKRGGRQLGQHPEFTYGAGEKSRTPDLRITNALLYQLSYAGVAGGGERRASRAF